MGIPPVKETWPGRPWHKERPCNVPQSSTIYQKLKGLAVDDGNLEKMHVIEIEQVINFSMAKQREKRGEK